MTEYGLRHGAVHRRHHRPRGRVRVLQHGERDLIVPFPEGGPIPDYRGIIAAPWPNRIADGKYTFRGAEYRLPINEVERDCALHGLAFPLDWTLKEHTESAVVLTCSVGPAPGYPFLLKVTAHYCAGRRRPARGRNGDQLQRRHRALRRVPAPVPGRRTGPAG